MIEVAAADRGGPRHVREQGVRRCALRGQLVGVLVEPREVSPRQRPERLVGLGRERQQTRVARGESVLGWRQPRDRLRQGRRDALRGARIGISSNALSRGAIRRPVPLQHNVRVHARNPECADPGPPRAARLLRPVLRLRRHAHRQRLPFDERVGVLEVKVPRDHPLLHRQHGLDQPGDPGRRLEMADVGLDRAHQQRAVDRAPLAVDRSGPPAPRWDRRSRSLRRGPPDSRPRPAPRPLAPVPARSIAPAPARWAPSRQRSRRSG